MIEVVTRREFKKWYRLDVRGLDALPEGLGVRRLTADDFRLSGQLMPGYFTPGRVNDFTTKLLSADNVAVGMVDEQGCVVAHGWIAFGRCASLPHPAIPPDEGYLWYQWVAPQHRGKGIYGKMLRFQMGEVKAAGRTWATIRVSTYNHASRRGIEKAGFERYHPETENGKRKMEKE